jgi:hypothetical protein
MDGNHTSSFDNPNPKHRYDRIDVASRLDDFDQQHPDISQRGFAEQSQTPRSTLRHWLQRRRELDLSPGLARFFESAEGTEFLHHILVAVHLVFEADCGCGLRNISRFLELSRLDRVIAASYGTQQAYAKDIVHSIVEFGTEQRQQLGPQMSPRDISVCEDETFHPETCLVAIEPVSGMILLEAYRDRRDAQTWNESLEAALEGLPVTVVQSVSDEALGLKAHAKDLGAHHSPDLFHVQQELSHATSVSLANEVRRRQIAAEKSLQAAREKADERDACLQQCPTSAAVNDLTAEAIALIEHARQKRQSVREAEARQAMAASARRGVSDDHHPFDLTDGSVRESEVVDRRLRERLDTLDAVAEAAGLSEAARARIAKARRVLPGLVATVAFFWKWVRERVSKLSLSEAVERSLIEDQLAGEYLSLAAAKASTAKRRRELRELSEQLLSRARDGPLSELPPPEREELIGECRSWAALFQRSSSCVEGRNGQLSLSHHSLHRLQGERLESLTVLANHFHRRADGTSAADRFYGQPSADLFEWLVDRVRRLPRPGKPQRV